MTAVPKDPLIFHITHVTNLPKIVAAGCLWSDAERIAQNLATTNIAHLHVKERRLRRPIPVAAKGMLGDYVPFNFCPRSVMLFAVSRGHASYGGGQDEVVHIVSSARIVEQLGLTFAFTDRHADVQYAEYYDDLDNLDAVDWAVMPRTYWNEDEVKSKRQAEFLVHRSFPWTAVRGLGVRTQATAQKVSAIVGENPVVAVKPAWYY